MAMQRMRSRRKKVCYFTQSKTEPDYKDVGVLRRFVNERGKIVPRRLSGVTPPNQRKLAVAVKRARYLALLPFVADNIK